ncbi:MAG: integration host factor subunit beta [Holosporales bacterium]|nr:integration host factor subunit beta [Holosporales bacterium]
MMSELIKKFNETHKYMGRLDAHKVVHMVFDNIKSALLSGHKAELRGFGTFSIRKRKARIGRNPRTGASVNIPAKNMPFFKAGKLLAQYVNSKK